MSKKEKNPVMSFAYALNGITLAMNMMLLTAYYMEKDEEFIPFTALQESYKKLNKYIESAADPEKKVNIQDIYIYGKKYLAEYKAFKKLSEVQDEHLQNILKMGIEEINRLLGVEDRYKEECNK